MRSRYKRRLVCNSCEKVKLRETTKKNNAEYLSFRIVMCSIKSVHKDKLTQGGSPVKRSIEQISKELKTESKEQTSFDILCTLATKEAKRYAPSLAVKRESSPLPPANKEFDLRAVRSFAPPCSASPYSSVSYPVYPAYPILQTCYPVVPIPVFSYPVARKVNSCVPELDH